MKSGVPSLTRLVTRAGRSTAILTLIAVFATALFSVSSSATLRRSGGGYKGSASATAPQAAEDAVASKSRPPASINRLPRGGDGVAASLLSGMMFRLIAPDSIATYSAGCSAPAHSFELGDTVCVQVSGGPSLSIIPRRVALIDAAGNVRSVVTITTDPQTINFTLPSTQTTVDGTQTFDNRGQWRVNIVPGSRFSVRDSAFFTVSDPSARVADLALYNSDNVDGTISVGTNGTDITFGVWVTNYGPDTATNVKVTNAVPTNATFVSAAEDAGSGPSFTCTNPAAGGSTGTTNCSIASLAAGQSAKFTLVYEAAGGSTVGTVISDTASITSDTTELNGIDNSATDSVVVVSGAADTCAITCPADIVATANTTDANNVHGAVVTFAPEASGNCGSVTASPSSGSFFPVGTTTVSVTSAGGSCSFNVIVTDTAPPTISGPPDQTVNADSGTCSATVDPGTPTTTGSGVTVDAVRDDGSSLSDPYPGGVTTITWTATDAQGRTASRAQHITVVTDDTTPPTIAAPPDVVIGTGPDATSCSVFVAEDRIGTPSASDNCSASVKLARAGVPAGNVFPKGDTTITYTATDGAGNKAIATQKVTVVDNTPPIIFAPADANYTCLSDVPTANASQAVGPLVDSAGVPVPDANGNLQPGGPVYDNCGGITVAVSETRSGAGTAANPLVITRTFTATDGANNSSSAAQTITVVDNTPPVLTVPADITASTDLGSCTATLNPGAATATDNCSGMAPPTGVRSDGLALNAAYPKGMTTITWTATDWAGNAVSAPQKVTVNDTEKPVLQVPANIVVGNDAGSCSALVNFSVTATDNCGGATVTTSVPSGTVFSKGTTTVTATATDTSGNTSTASFTVTVNDTEKPVVNVPANIVVSLPLNSTATTVPVSYSVTATDNCPGVTFGVSPVSGSAFSAGTTTVTATATDAAGNVTTRTFTVTVLYNFTGFFSPVANLPTLNSVKAGSAIPVKFSLSGNKGLNIFLVGAPDSQQIACDTGAPVSNLDATVTAGGSSLSYDASSDQYNYVWKTDSAWVGTCRQLVLGLKDGSARYARFKFK
jgi:uncharacterized repeat protein (TIGR01451 family)